MATIPDNQNRIYLLLKDIEDDIANQRVSSQVTVDAIRVCTVDCNRRKILYKAPVTSDTMDYTKQIEILQTRVAHPDWSLQKIGTHCNVNGARVSEVLRGKRK